MDKLTLDDVRFFGRHGVTRAEETVGAWFSVDVELGADLAPAAVSDDLAAAIDYGAVAKRVVEIGTGPRVNLIERLAGEEPDLRSGDAQVVALAPDQKARYGEAPPQRH